MLTLDFVIIDMTWWSWSPPVIVSVMHTPRICWACQPCLLIITKLQPGGRIFNARMQFWIILWQSLIGLNRLPGSPYCPYSYAQPLAGDLSNTMLHVSWNCMLHSAYERSSSCF